MGGGGKFDEGEDGRLTHVNKFNAIIPTPFESVETIHTHKKNPRTNQTTNLFVKEVPVQSQTVKPVVRIGIVQRL